MLTTRLACCAGAARALRDTSAILSIVVRNQAGEVFKAAIQAGDLAAAEANLTAEWGFESLYGGKVRLFTSGWPAGHVECGVVGIDLLSEVYACLRITCRLAFLAASEYARILELERKLGSRPEYAAVARYTHYLARRMDRMNAA